MSHIAQFNIEYLQYLDLKGKPSQDLPIFAKNKQELLNLYKYLVLMRVFDQKAVTLQRTGKIGTYAGILGQEAISVGIGSAMKQDDVFCPAYREYGTMIQRGVKLSDILSFWGGDERGNCFGHPEDFPFCVPIGTQTLHAAGVATAFKIRNQSRCAVTVIGDGGTSQGDFYEAMNVAGDWKLPLVFVINNNQWAISVPRRTQTNAETLAQKAIAAGFEGIQIDGNDIIAVKDTMEKALDKARQGKGPTLIEALTYRLCDHTTADDAKRYRPDQEVEDAKLKEPLIRFTQFLKNQNYLSDSEEEKIKQTCVEEVELAVKEYCERTPQQPSSMFDYHYATLPKDLQEQRQEFLESL